MQKTLNDITTLYSGIYAKAQPLANTLYLQVSDFDQYGVLKKLTQPILNANTVRPNHLLQPNDILFAAKGANNFAAIYTNADKPAVASSSFIIIRIKAEFSNIVLPAF